METLQFSVRISAKPETVYHSITDPDHFREWTAPFSPTSYFKGTWEKGTTMRFLATDEKGSPTGMLSRIRENIPNKYICLEHFGWIHEEREITEGEDVERIKGALENYTITPEGDYSVLRVESDTLPEMKEFFLETWPRALDVIRRISEK